MVLLGVVWSAVGAGWLYHLGPGDLFREGASVWPFATPTALLVGGLLLVKTGVTPDRPRRFEDEVADAHPDLSNESIWWD